MLTIILKKINFALGKFDYLKLVNSGYLHSIRSNQTLYQMTKIEKFIIKIFILILLFIISNSAFSQWEADVRLTNDPAVSESYYRGGLIVKGDSVHVVWADKRNGNFEIYYKRSVNGGNSWGPDTRLTYNDSSSTIPFVALSGSTLHVVWADNRDRNSEIYHKSSADGGSTWGTETRLSIDTGKSMRPAIAVSGSEVHVVWCDYRDNTYKLHYKRSKDAGLNWGKDTKLSEFPLNIASIVASGTDVHIASDENHSGVYNIYYLKSTNGGDTFLIQKQLTNSPGNAISANLAISGSMVYLVWRDGNSKVYFKQSADKGFTWQEDTRLAISPGLSAMPSVAVSGSNIHIIWQDNRSANWEIYYKYSKDGGTSWSMDSLLVDNKSTASQYASVVSSGSGLHVIWSDFRDGNKEIYYKRNLTANKTVGVPDIKIRESEFNLYPNPASDNISISYPDLTKKSISIFNSLGLELKRFSENEFDWRGTFTFSLKSFPTGVYYCIISSGTNKMVTSFVVER